MVRNALPVAAATLALVLAGCFDPVSLEVAPQALDFGDVAVGDAAHQTVALTLGSAGPAHLSVRVEPPGPFLITDQLPATLSSGEALSVPVAFQPDALGSVVAVLVIEVDAVDALTRVDVPLRGFGLDRGRDADRDGVPFEEDCDDHDPAVFPGATEVCDGVDNDCDGALPEREQDVDGDGFSPCEGDCDDAEDTAFPLAPEYCDGIDNNCDGDLEESDADLDGWRGCDGDCDDADPLRFPTAEERCNGLDDDCDTAVPPREADDDADQHRICEGDCDDTDPAVNPSASELCDGVDTDCDLAIPLDEYDGDLDGFLECAECDDDAPLVFPGAPELCDGIDNDCDGVVPGNEIDDDLDGALACEDCDDADPLSFPGAPEQCDGADNDCDGVVPADETTDADADGWYACDDCDDLEATVSPGALEICDGVDTDCDGTTPPDELVDDDLDGWLLCEDCDDAIGTVNPGAAELCDGLDTDCDTVIPGTEIDDDGDGAIECDGSDCDDTDDTVFVGAFEECYDAVDNDCDTVVNQGCTCPTWGALSAPAGCVSPGTYECPHVGAQAAITATESNGSCADTWLQAGTYLESLQMIQGGSLIGEGPASAVVLDGAGAGRVLDIDTTGAVTLATLTITGGLDSSGGGIDAEELALTITDVVFDQNDCTAGGLGGALHCDECTLTLTDSVFTDNDCGYGGSNSGNDGGAVYLTGGGASFIQGNTFEGNTAGDGAAIRAGGASSGSFHVITQNLFYENDTSDSTNAFGETEGGALLMQGNRVAVSNNVFFANAGTQGGGGLTVSSAGGGSYVTNNVFVYNSSGTNEGAGVHIDSLAFANSMNLYNNIFVSNTGRGVYAEASLPSNMGYNAYFQNSGGAFGQGSFGTPVQSGNVTVDPLFVALSDDSDYTNDDFTLGTGSQCIDAGNPASLYDDPDGSRNDMGIYGGVNGNW